MNDIRRIKQQLRRDMRRRAAELPADYCRAADAGIIRFVLSQPEYLSSRTIFCFVGREREINTQPLLETILSQGRGLAVPRCLTEGRMELRLVASLAQLAPGAYGILEPGEDLPLISADQVDLAVVPCLTCDRQGRRLGQGGGFYDRWLAGYQGKSFLVCRERMMAENVPCGYYDQKFPLIITELGVRRVTEED